MELFATELFLTIFEHVADVSVEEELVLFQAFLEVIQN